MKKDIPPFKYPRAYATSVLRSSAQTTDKSVGNCRKQKKNTAKRLLEVECPRFGLEES